MSITSEDIHTLYSRAISLFFTFVVSTVFLVSSTQGTETEPALGKPTAPVTLIEYGSLTCDYCIRFHRQVFPAIFDEYIETGKVRFIFRDFPTSEEARRGAVAARCAADQYYKMLDTLFLHVGKWSLAENVDEALVEQARSLGLDETKFRACLNDPDREAAVTQSQQHAKETFDVTGTPSFLINGELVRGRKNKREMKQLIEAALPKDN